jgi:hypothetical protein
MGGIVDAVVNIVESFVSWLIPVPEVPEFDIQESESAQGILLNKESNNAQIPVVYGQRKLGITRVYVETSGTDNQYLYLAGVICEGEINSIEKIFIDDTEVTFDGALSHHATREVASSDSTYYKDGQSYIQVEAFLGKDGQTASDILSTQTNWGSNHRLRGVAYLAFRFTWNQDIFGAIPNVKVLVKGKKVYDPRTTSTAYSPNSALCLLDFLRNSRYGKGLPDAAFETSFASFATAANTCETQVTPYSGASTINLFETNGVIDTSQKVIDNVRKLLNPMRAFFTYTEGVYKLTVEGTGSAAKTITKDNVVGGAKLLGERKNNKYNRVIATFVNPDKNFQEDTISYPPNDDSGLASADQQATMETADGVLLEGNFSFPNVTSVYQAQGLAEVILRRSRNQLQVQVRVTSEFLDAAVGEIVNIDYPTGGFSNKPFRVQGMTINEDLTVDLQLFEHQDNFYTWAEKTEAPTIADTILPNPNTVQPPASVTLDDNLIEYNDGTVIVALDITVGASPDNFVDFYQVEYKKSTDSDFIIYAQGSGLNHRVLNVIDQQTYDVRVKAVNTLGVSSTYVSAQRTIVGAIAPPSDVTDFSCNILGQEAHLGWEQIPDLDLAFYNLRFSEETDGTADWQNSVALVEKVSRPATSISVPARTGTYLIKAVDKLGNFSSNATAIISNVTGALNFNAVATQAEHPTFAGTLTNTVITDNAIELDSSELFDAASGNFDDETTRFFDSGVSNSDFFASGNYEFANVVDIGAKHTARITASLTQTSDNPDDLFDNRTGNFDDASSNFDGDTPANCNAHIEIATSDDNVTYTDFRAFVIGEYTARFFKFRVVLISRDGASTPVVSEVSVSVDMQDRIFSGNDIVSGTGTKSITFTNPFKSANYAVGVTGQGMATGDYFTVSNKTINGFDVAFFNSSNTGVSKTFDFIAKGF